MKTKLGRPAILNILLVAMLTGIADAQELSTVVEFGPTELPESIALNEGSFATSLILSNEVRTYDLSGNLLSSASVPFPGGVDFAGDDTLFVTSPAGFFVDDPATVAESHGIWRVTPDGDSQIEATVPLSTLPNDLDVGPDQRVYVTDSTGGAIWVVEDGEAEVWLEADILLGGNVENLPQPNNGARPPLAVGAGGIDFFGNTLYASNVDRGLIVASKLREDGSATDAEIVFQSDLLIGNDGIGFDSAGNLYVGVPFQDHVIRIDSDFTTATILADFDDGLLNPAGVAYLEDEGDLLISNFQFFQFNVTGAEGLNPSILRLSNPVPEPSAFSHSALAILLLLMRWRSAREW